MPVKSTPIACPLNTGGGLEGADDPKAWAGPVMRVSMADESKLVDVPQPATFTLKNKEAIPESLSVLLYQHGSIRQTAVHGVRSTSPVVWRCANFRAFPKTPLVKIYLLHSRAECMLMSRYRTDRKVITKA